MNTDNLTYQQKIALRYYKAYLTLRGDVGEELQDGEKEALTLMRTTLFQQYKKYDPDNSFDVSRY